MFSMTKTTTKCFKIKKEWIDQRKEQEIPVIATSMIAIKKPRVRKKLQGVKKPSPALQKQIDHGNACINLHCACAKSDMELFGHCHRWPDGWMDGLTND